MSQMGTTTKEENLGICKLGSSPFTTIEDVLYVEVLKHNLLSISQLCDKCFKINFTKYECLIEDEATHEVKLMGKIINNIFIISLDDLYLKTKCIMVSKQ